MSLVVLMLLGIVPLMLVKGYLEKAALNHVFFYRIQSRIVT